MSNIVKLRTYRYEIDWSYEYEVEINVDEYVYFTVDWRGERSWHLIGHKVDENHNWSEKELSYDWCFLRDIADFIARANNIKDNTAFIKESNGEVWYCPKTDIIDEVSERDLFLDIIKEIVETNNWDGNKDKKIEHLQSQLDHQKVMWNELKEWVLDTLKEKRNSPKYYKFNDVLDKMQELEKGEKDEV